MTILCVGALALDTIFRLDALPTAPGKYLPRETVEVVEGMATAQAASIARLGGKARLWASAGDDLVGERMLAELSAEGVDVSAVRLVAGAKSGVASILLDATGEKIVTFYYDPALASTPTELPRLDDVTVVSVDLRWPDAAAIALGAAKERGIPGVLDLERGPAEVLQRLVPLASHIVASAHGIAQLTGIDDVARATAALAATHGGFIAATEGEKGCWWFDRASDKPRHVAARAVKAIDTLAAGDVFHAAFAIGLTEKMETEVALRFASAAAALKCTRFGGRLGAPKRDEVEAFLKA